MKSLQTAGRSASSKMEQLGMLLLIAAMSVTGTAQAALPDGLSTSLDSLEADALAAVDLVLPVVIAVTSAFIMIKIVKRVLGKV